MSFASFLDKIGSDIAGIFRKAKPILDDVLREASVIAPFLPAGIGAALTTGINLVGLAEGTAAAAGAQAGTGPTKAAAVIAALHPVLNQALIDAGVPAAKINTGVTQNVVNAIVAMLNALPAPEQVEPVNATPAKPPVAPAGAIVK